MSIQTTMNREEFFKLVDRRSPYAMRLIQTAYWLSKNVHRVQTRDGGDRYFEHPRSVAQILMEQGYDSTDSIIVALLHDVLEDTYTPPYVIKDLFGRDMLRNIRLISKKVPRVDPQTGQIEGWDKKTEEEYYRDLITKAPPCVYQTKLADRIHNLRTCKGVWEPAKISQYIKNTIKYVLPLVRRTDHRLHALLIRELENLKG